MGEPVNARQAATGLQQLLAFRHDFIILQAISFGFCADAHSVGVD